MADINQVIAGIGAGLAASAPVRDWARVHYGRDCSVFENCDPRNPPPQDVCPLVIVYHLDKTAGLANMDKRISIGVACWVYDDARPESIEGVTRFTGVRRAEELRQLALAEVVGCLSAALSLEMVDTEFNPHMDFPLVSADMALGITEETLIGQDPFE